MERNGMPKTPRRSATLRRHATESLAASGAFYPLVFAQSPVPMWVVDGATLTLLAVNDAAVRDSGYTRAELLDLTVPALCPPEDLAVVLATPLEPASQARAVVGRLRRKDGGFLEVHLTWTPLTVEGKPAWLVLLTAPMGREPSAVAVQIAHHELTRPLPELTANLVDAHRVLQAALEESQATEAHLRARLRNRDVKLQEMQHRVKTTLQLAMSLFNLQRAQNQDARLTAPFVASAQRLKVLALLHEVLDHASPEMNIDGAVYLHALRAAVIRTYRVDTHRIALTADLEPLALPLAQAQPCGLILNELLTNAVLHAFPEGRSGMVTMELHGSSEGSVMLRVTDTGVGVSAALDIHQPTRLGWQLVTLLTQQLHGELVLERDRGTRITVRWPLIGPGCSSSRVRPLLPWTPASGSHRSALRSSAT
jgi:PAS domain S-box-containing protein